MPKSEDLNRSIEINAILTFNTEFLTIYNKSRTYINSKSAVKHRQLSYGYIWVVGTMGRRNNGLNIQSPDSTTVFLEENNLTQAG